ncbi:ribosomal protein L7/L12 [Leptolyngbya cf. ectocarpi LEGE 11479]|uniref:Ribosomal protein L7/L12 n=1 Tax=Leptolyngbya cf. ectocarpi LEGE 11479 TaxID=1828722 RepID=A0A928X4U7_LEPEC|nr:ribosomal protein L7/L12 [Leptolyngbya ectocarpi]MBE9066683.1 ribosomal protein L7/L12 [Leptolyngbya cf. ectocarpi LEGE 11479]
MVIIYVAIALFILIIIWLALQPKQGATAANAPKKRADDYDDPAHQLPAELPSAPLPQPTPPKVDYELPTADLEAGVTEKSNIQDQVRSLMQSNQNIAALKLVRSATGWGLKAAKDYVETYPDLAPLTPQANSPEVEDSPEEKNLDDQIRDLLKKHQKVSAIKLVRETKGWGLKQAKDYVERFPNPASFTFSYNSTIADNHQSALESFDIDRHTVNDRIRILLAEGRKIGAIKLVRMVTNWSLKDSKEYIDNYPDVAPLKVTDRGPVSETLQKLLSQRQHIDAITLVQSRTGMSVEEAKHYLEKTFECDFPF